MQRQSSTFHGWIVVESAHTEVMGFKPGDGEIKLGPAHSTLFFLTIINIKYQNNYSGKDPVDRSFH